MIQQLCIALTGVVAIWLTQAKDPRQRRWACVFGLIGQPFWFWSAWSAGQWGVFTLCFFYTAAWVRGVKNNWFDRPGRLEKLSTGKQTKISVKKAPPAQYT